MLKSATSWQIAVIAPVLGLLTLALPMTAAEAGRMVDSGYGRINEQPSGGFTTWWVGGSAADCARTNLQTALTDAADGDIVLVARDGNYAGQGFNVHGKGLTIRGGYDSCLSDPNNPSGRTVLNASGANRPVIDFFSLTTTENRHLVLENLQVSGGTAYEFAGGGGGILVDGVSNRMQLELINTRVSGNQGPSGGGIYLWSKGNDFNLNFWFRMDANSEIRDNQATAGIGGGLRCSEVPDASSTNTIVRIDGGRISGNTASVDGGGIHVAGCKNVQIIPKRVNVNDGIWGNSAGLLGGGLLASGGARVFIRGFLGDPVEDPGPQVAAEIFGNQSAAGGAIAVSGSETLVSVSNTIVHGNSASGSGGAFWVGSGARLQVRRPGPDQSDCKPVLSALGLLTPGKAPCSQVSGNQSGQSGGAFHVSSAQLQVERSYVMSNTAASFGGALNATRQSALPNEPDIEIISSVFSGNSGNNIFRLRNTEMLMLWSTVVDNQPAPFTAIMGSVATDLLTAIVDVRGSILWEPGETLVAAAELDPGSTALTNAECVIGSSPADSVDFGGLQNYSHIDPGFRDLADSDFRLAPDSPAIDYCSGLDFASALDLAGRARGVPYDMPTIEPPNPGSGLFDLGAWEQQRVRIFQDRFENGAP